MASDQNAYTEAFMAERNPSSTGAAALRSFEWHAMTRDMEDLAPRPRPTPSENDRVAASIRQLAVRVLLTKHGDNPQAWPADVRAEYLQLLEQQAEYEATFGKCACR